MAMQISAPDAFAFQNGAGKCTDCHTLTKEEASKLIKADKFKVQVKGVSMSPVKGIWEIEITQGEKTGVVFVDFAKKHLIEGAKFTKLDTLGEMPPLPKVDTKKIPLDGAIVMGNPKGEKKVIIFDDPDCPYCAKLHEDLKKIVAKRKDVGIFVKMFPLTIHPQAYEKSKAIVCAKSAKLLDDAFTGKQLPKAACETAELDNNIKLAKELGIEGTPAIIFPDGRLLRGYVPSEVFEELLDKPEGKKAEEKK